MRLRRSVIQVPNPCVPDCITTSKIFLKSGADARLSSLWVRYCPICKTEMTRRKGNDKLRGLIVAA